VHGWTVDLVKFLLDDPNHGTANREVVTGWITDWLPHAGEAAQALQPVFDELPAGIGFEDARTNTRIDFDELCEQCGVAEAAVAAGGAK
jgi:hypothetical protein